MANLPPSFSLKSVAPSSSGASSSSTNDRNSLSVEQLILDISNPERRENALHQLSKVIVLPNSLTWEFLIVWVFVFCVLFNVILKVFGSIVRCILYMRSD